MSFTKPGPIFGYATGDLIDEADINYWCTALPDCMDGAGGGSYTLSADMTIAGTGPTVEWIFDLPVEFNDTVTCYLGATLYDTVIIGIAASDDLTVEATSVFNAPATFNGNVTLGNAVSDTVTLNAVLSPGTGRIRHNGLLANDADQAVDMASYRCLHFVSSLGAHTYTLSYTGAADGDWFILSNRSSNTQTIAGIIAGSLTTNTSWMMLRIAGSWQRVI